MVRWKKWETEPSNFLYTFWISFWFLEFDCVAKVKQAYYDLCLPNVFNDCKKRNHMDVMHLIDQLLQSDKTFRNACINFFSQWNDGSTYRKSRQAKIKAWCWAVMSKGIFKYIFWMNICCTSSEFLFCPTMHFTSLDKILYSYVNTFIVEFNQSYNRLESD